MNPWLFAGISALALAFAGGYQVASTSCDAARLATEKAALEQQVATLRNWVKTANAASQANALRARDHAERLAELQEILDGVESDDRVCFPADSDAIKRLRLLR